MNKDKIVIVDDDADIRNVLLLYLRKAGYEVFEADTGEAGVALFERVSPQLLVLDVMLPGLDGLEVCQMIRRKSDVPIIFLSAKVEDIDKIVALGIGGDDYMTKPFSPSVFTAKVKAQLRRNRLSQIQPGYSLPQRAIVDYPGLIIDESSYTVKANGEDIQLSAKEFKILCVLAHHPNRVYTVEQLFQMVWGEDSFGDHRTVMVHISNLRKKIETNPANPTWITTVRGIGYKFTPARS